VSEALTEQAFAKVNLTLRVLGRRADGYHELESLVAFADLVDMLVLQPGSELVLDISGPFAAASGNLADNLVLKAVAALRERVIGLKAGRFRLTKNIPVAGGLGGGSADAAAALRLLARANNLAAADPRIAAAALAVGADVPICLESKPRIMRGIGEILSAPVGVPRWAAVLVNPGVPLSTREVFGAFSVTPGRTKNLSPVPVGADTLVRYLEENGNDLTAAAVARVPVVADALAALQALPGCRFAAMSGSGPTCFALFATLNAAEAGSQQLRAAAGSWWVHCGTIGTQP
jgi:4-diphosphocytidyl-2-C-methyl-D-erythritol kinase